MIQKGSQNDPKMAPKSFQVGPKIGSQTICLHANASSPSVRAQRPLRKPIWDPFGAHLGSIWARFSTDFGQLWTYKEDLDRIMDWFPLHMSNNIPITELASVLDLDCFENVFVTFEFSEIHTSSLPTWTKNTSKNNPDQFQTKIAPNWTPNRFSNNLSPR